MTARTTPPTTFSGQTIDAIEKEEKSNMRVAVTYDKDGTILTLFDPDKMTSKDVSLTYVPAKGERHEILDVPKELEGKPLTELPNLLRVAEGEKAKLEAKR
jgi:hypothetical protein